MFAKLKKLLSRRYFPAGKYGRVRLLDRAIEFSGHNGELWSLAFANVIRIEAFKHDLFGYDEITLALIDTADASWLVSEEDDGYEIFLEKLPGHFPGIRTDWYSHVAQPPFAENRTVLWNRSTS